MEHCRVVVGTLDGDIWVWCKQLCLVDLDHLENQVKPV